MKLNTERERKIEKKNSTLEPERLFFAVAALCCVREIVASKVAS